MYEYGDTGSLSELLNRLIQGKNEE